MATGAKIGLCAPARPSPRILSARSRRSLGAEFSKGGRPHLRPRYNAAPSGSRWILRHGADRRIVGRTVWGYRAKDRPLINVRGENVGAGSFREAFESTAVRGSGRRVLRVERRARAHCGSTAFAPAQFNRILADICIFRQPNESDRLGGTALEAFLGDQGSIQFTPRPCTRVRALLP